MLYVIIGGSGSGKSEYGENKVMELSKGKHVYIATMKPFGKEAQSKIERHRQMRRNNGFTSIECFDHLQNIKVEKDTTLILECMSNVSANVMFSDEATDGQAYESIVKGVKSLLDQADHLVVITNNIFEDGIDYDRETRHYMELLAQLNEWLCNQADQVVEIVHGIEILLKERKRI